MSRKKKLRRTHENNQSRRRDREDEFIHVVLGVGENGKLFDDDCPLCRELRESGDPVFTIDECGELFPIEFRPDRETN